MEFIGPIRFDGTPLAEVKEHLHVYHVSGLADTANGRSVAFTGKCECGETVRQSGDAWVWDSRNPLRGFRKVIFDSLSINGGR